MIFWEEANNSPWSEVLILARSFSETEARCPKYSSMARMSLGTRARVVTLWKAGFTFKRIQELLLLEGLSVSVTSLCLLVVSLRELDLQQTTDQFAQQETVK